WRSRRSTASCGSAWRPDAPLPVSPAPRYPLGARAATGAGGPDWGRHRATWLALPTFRRGSIGRHGRACAVDTSSAPVHYESESRGGRHITAPSRARSRDQAPLTGQQDRRAFLIGVGRTGRALLASSALYSGAGIVEGVVMLPRVARVDARTREPLIQPSEIR